MDTDTKLEATNLPKNVTEEEIESIFIPFGNIANIQLANTKAMIQFEESSDCKNALMNMDGYELNDRFITVRLYTGS